MNALVTGGTGFVGSHLIDALLARGQRVTALVRSPSGAAPLEARGVRLVRGDLHDLGALAEATAGQNVVYHVAGIIAARSEAEFLRGNHDGTANLVAATVSSGGHASTPPRFILVSSLAAVGPATPGAPVRGDPPARPVTQYGRSKLAGEAVVRRAALPWTIVRPPTVYGPRDHEVLKVFKLARLGLGPVFGDGAQELSAVFAPDFAEALIAAAHAPATVGRVYYPCHAEIITARAFVRAVGRSLNRTVVTLPIPRIAGRAALAITSLAARFMGQATILTADKANEFFQPAWTCDPYELWRDAGWRAAHDLEAGLAATARWYRDAGWL